jgi:hypothetical protein
MKSIGYEYHRHFTPDSKQLIGNDPSRPVGVASTAFASRLLKTICLTHNWIATPQHILTKLGQHDLRRIFPNLDVLPGNYQTRGMHTLIRNASASKV